MPIQNKKAFTLVELIVVITILAILWTIAFISLQWYSASARDSARVTDLGLIKKSFEIYSLDKSEYPEPTGWKVVTYEWGDAWTQWTFWEATYRSVKRLSNIPLDPLTKKEYVYSLTTNKQEYQLAIISETEDDTAINNSLNTYASEETAILKVVWNYNGATLEVNTGSMTYILAVPSIMTSIEWTLENIVNSWALAFNWLKNLPYQYTNNWDKKIWETWGLNIVNKDSLVVFSWSLKDLTNSPTKRIEFTINLQKAYSGTLVSNTNSIKPITEIDLTDDSAIDNLATKIVNSNLWGSITEPAFLCTTTSNLPHIIPSKWVPTKVNQEWKKGDSWACTYKCAGWYKWEKCDENIEWKSCKKILSDWKSNWNWYYKINPTDSKTLKVYCDMTTDWGGWTRFVNIKWNYTIEDAKKCWLWSINNPNLECFNPNRYWINPDKLMNIDWLSTYYTDIAWGSSVTTEIKRNPFRCLWHKEYMTIMVPNVTPTSDWSDARYVWLWRNYCKYEREVAWIGPQKFMNYDTNWDFWEKPEGRKREAKAKKTELYFR
jgi:prepilin-type N-terminal cleavage/methylation domain-containing protein